MNRGIRRDFGGVLQKADFTGDNLDAFLGYIQLSFDQQWFFSLKQCFGPLVDIGETDYVQGTIKIFNRDISHDIFSLRREFPDTTHDPGDEDLFLVPAFRQVFRIGVGHQFQFLAVA